jgi:hypothetical protein
LVANIERPGLSSRLVNEFPQWLASAQFGGSKSKSAVARTK